MPSTSMTRPAGSRRKRHGRRRICWPSSCVIANACWRSGRHRLDGAALVEHGFHVDGVDLSEPMLQRLREKISGSRISLAVADATRLPFRTGSVEGAYLRHVLHLIPDWRTALAELVRVVRPGGRVLVSITDYTGLYEEVQKRFLLEAGDLPEAVGLQPDDPGSLMGAMSKLGARCHQLPPIRGRRALTLNQFLEHIEQGHYTWTWPVPEAERRGASRRVRAWLDRRFGDLDRPVEPEYTIEWWAFDLAQKPIVGGAKPSWLPGAR